MTSHTGFVIYFLWIVISSDFSSAIDVSLQGNGFISYDLSSSSIATETNHITFSFKTFRPSGLMVHSSGTQGDFLTIELVHGQVRLTIDLGSTQTISGKHSVIVGDNNLADNKWHDVTLDRNGRKVVLSVDRSKNESTTPGSFVRLDLDTFIYVGGLDTSQPADFFGAQDSPKFHGCLRNLFFQFKDIFFAAKIPLEKCSTHGDVRFQCPNTQYVPVGLSSPDAYLKLSIHSPMNFSVQLSFRTYDSNGVLLYKQSANARLYLKLASGKLALEILIGTDKPIKISVGEDLSNGMWHDVTAGVARNELWLQLDEKPELRHENPWLSKIGDFRRHVFVGYGQGSTGFVGCIHGIRLNGNLVDPLKLSRSRINGSVINSCGISSKCFPNPCLNSGRCLQTWRAFSCDCGGTFYHGARCEIPLYRATCQEYKALGMIQDAYCKVDPDGTGPLGPFNVLCNMTASDAAMTVVNQDKRGRHKVTLGATKVAGHYFQRITYDKDMASVRALIERSANCRQYISYQCYNSKLLNSPIGPANVKWLSTKAAPQNYWGGAPAGSTKCGCGVTKSCVDPSKYCNCDADGDNMWREDSGYLRDKSALPVSVLQFSTDAQHSYFVLGPLECFGSSGVTSSQVTNANFISSACRLVNPPPTVNFQTTPRGGTGGVTIGGSTTSKPPGNIPYTLAPRKPAVGGHVTLTTTIAMHDNSTLVTSVISHKAKNGSTNDGVTVHSSVTAGKGGVTVHSSITSKGKTVTLPPVTSREPKTPRVVVIRNGSVSHITRIKGGVEYDVKFIILVTTSVLAFMMLILVIIFIFLKRSGRTYVCCATCHNCRRKKSIPDIEVYHHSGRPNSPDVVGMDDMNHGTVEVGAYSMSNGQTVYHSVHRNSHVRKYVSFSPSTSEL